MDIKRLHPDKWVEDELVLQQLIERDTATWNSIPLLNANDMHNIKNNSLVRFKGMIQDMHGPEYYANELQVHNAITQEIRTKNGKYLDVITEVNPEEKLIFDEDSPTGERYIFVAISVPALNNWVVQMEENKWKVPIASPSCQVNPQQKRRFGDTAMEVGQASPEHGGYKRLCSNQEREEQPEGPPTLPPETLMNFPIPDPKGQVCMLKVYKNGENLKLNAVCEFVGFISLDPILAHFEYDPFLNQMELQVHNPPPSLIPRIHCIAYKPLQHYNPLVAPVIGAEKFSKEKMQTVKKDLMIVLTQLLFGDELAAEFLLYNLISEVYLRRDFMALGKFAVNISNIPTLGAMDVVEEIYKFIADLVPKSHLLPLTRENLNELSFIPKKDYECNRLNSSILQLSNNTHLVIDETKLTEGNLNEAGIRGVQALGNAIRNQRNVYDFTYYHMDFDCDIAFLVFSDGKSMLPSDYHIALRPDELHLNTYNEILVATRHFLRPELLNDIRKYLTMSRHVAYQLTEESQPLIENAFVKIREQDNRVNAEDLHYQIILARLVSISEGFNSLNESCWNRAMHLQAMRKERLNK